MHINIFVAIAIALSLWSGRAVSIERNILYLFLLYFRNKLTMRKRKSIEIDEFLTKLVGKSMSINIALNSYVYRSHGRM